jgi:hypothetical protein
MKKLVVFLFISTISFISCSKDNVTNSIEEDPLSQNLLAYYNFDSTYAEKNGVFQGEVKSCNFGTDKSEKPNNAVQFNGINSSIEIPFEFDLEVKTISMWLYAESISNDYGVAYVSDNPKLKNGNTIIAVKRINAVPSLLLYRGSKMDTVKINEKQWYHIAMISNKKNCSYYLNGNQISQSVINSFIHSVDGFRSTIIGSARTIATYYFHGKIDELYIYNRELTSTEIKSLHSK